MLLAGRTLRACRFAPVHLPQRNHRVFLFGYLHFVPVRSARFHRGARGPDQPHFPRPEEICKIRGDRPWTVIFRTRILRGMVLPERDLVVLGDNFRKLRNPPAQAEVQVIADKLDALITALQR